MFTPRIFISFFVIVEQSITCVIDTDIDVYKRQVIDRGGHQAAGALLGATFIAICSFLPLYLAPASVAEIVKPLFVVLAVSLGLSWILDVYKRQRPCW